MLVCVACLESGALPKEYMTSSMTQHCAQIHPGESKEQVRKSAVEIEAGNYFDEVPVLGDPWTYVLREV